MTESRTPYSPPALDPQELARKLARFFQLHEVTRDLALAGLKHDHPDASPPELRRLLRKRLAFFRKRKWGQ